jgi:hypothetical protein
MKSLSRSRSSSVTSRTPICAARAADTYGSYASSVTPKAERRCGDEDADPAETDDADGLLVDLHAAVLRALPRPALERLVGGGDVAGAAMSRPTANIGPR